MRQPPILFAGDEVELLINTVTTDNTVNTTSNTELTGGPDSSSSTELTVTNFNFYGVRMSWELSSSLEFGMGTGMGVQLLAEEADIGEITENHVIIQD